MQCIHHNNINVQTVKTFEYDMLCVPDRTVTFLESKNAVNNFNNVTVKRLKVCPYLNADAGLDLGENRLLVGGGRRENRHALVVGGHAQTACAAPLQRFAQQILGHDELGVCLCLCRIIVLFYMFSAWECSLPPTRFLLLLNRKRLCQDVVCD